MGYRDNGRRGLKNFVLENSIEVLYKIKNRTTIWSSNSTPGYLSRRIRNEVLKNYLYTHVHSSMTHSSHKWKQPECPLTGEWISKCGVYMQRGVIPRNGMLFPEKEKNPATCYNTGELPGRQRTGRRHGDGMRCRALKGTLGQNEDIGEEVSGI